MSNPEDTASEFDDFDPSYGPEIDADFAEDLGEAARRGPGTQAAWQRLDERNDEAWLREQLADWDDWDEDADLH